MDGESYESIARDIGCSTGAVFRSFHSFQNLKVNEVNDISKGGFVMRNLNNDIDNDNDKNIDIDKNVNEKSTQQPTPANNFEKMVSTANRLGYTMDEATSQRIMARCDEADIADYEQWFRFVLYKVSEKGLLHGKDKDQCKRIVFSAAINKGDKWAYLAEDYPGWLESHKPKAWSSGIKLPPVEECATDEEVAQIFSNLKFRSCQTDSTTGTS